VILNGSASRATLAAMFLMGLADTELGQKAFCMRSLQEVGTRGADGLTSGAWVSRVFVLKPTESVQPLGGEGLGCDFAFPASGETPH
jgi:hypothetical protein